MTRFAFHRNEESRNYQVCYLESKVFSGYAAQIISKKGLEQLSLIFGRQHIGVLIIQLPDFYEFVGINGEDAGAYLFGLFRGEVLQNFEKFFSNCSIILAEPLELNKIILCFEMPEQILGELNDTMRTFRLNIRNELNKKNAEISGCQPLDILAGYAHIDKDQKDSFYRMLFRGFCEALQVGIDNINHLPFCSLDQPSLNTAQTPDVSAVKKISHEKFNSFGLLKELIQPAIEIQPDTLIRDAMEMLKNQLPMTCLVIVDAKKPVGLLMNYELNRKLGTRYGVSLYYHRDVCCIMDRNPLIVDIKNPLKELAQTAVSRQNAKIYDDIIVTENGALLGTVSVRKMIDYLAEIQIKMAMGANPLTRLPGNMAIEQEINSRKTKNLPGSLIYLDLDHFKAFNDVYGFEEGDRILLFTAKTIQEMVKKHGTPDDFIGHVGGDDFVIISELHAATQICQAICNVFEKKIAEFYPPEDRQKKYIIAKDRDGVEKQFEFISVSIGIIDCEFRDTFTKDELSRRVAAIKKYAKSIPGNSCVEDRRTPLGSDERYPF